ncbi:MAG: LuxR C-terminal-related transcriptional regulator [Chloroflexota bacterium]
MMPQDVKQAKPKRPLLKTKLFMPRSRPDVVARPRLVAQLNTAVSPSGELHPKLTLITGPAGYGKTTLATQWITQLNHPAAWLSLDSGDNDIARFLAYLFAAIGTVQEEIGEAAMARLTTTYLYNEPEAILTALLNDLAVCAETAVIVLDDYHVIHSDAVHQAVTFILQHAPVQLHLVITSRSQPPLPVAHLRAQNSLSWINARELRFTIEEATRFLQETMNLTLTPAEIEQLDAQVEGWVTGLQLAALALHEGVALPAATSGNARYLVDYLADQVFDRQPEEVQAFLLQTAVLDRFCTSLCNAIALPPINSSSQTLLRHIETANLFLIPLDAERNWYRYHHLFGDFLNGRLQQQYPADTINELHRAAACWYQENEQPLVAVEHALAAGDFELAAHVIRAVGHEVLMFGEGLTLRQWIEHLPDELQANNPRLTLFYIWSLLRTGGYKQAKMLLKEMSEQADTQLTTPLLWGEWSALRARLAVMTGDTDVNIRFSNKALSKLPPDQHMLRSEVAINLGFSQLQLGELEAARAAFAEAAQNTAHDPGLWAVMFATYYWGQTYERELQLTAAFAVYRRGLETASAALVALRQNGDSPSPAVGYMHIGLGKILYEWNRLAEAEMHLRRGLACAVRCGDHKMLIYAREALAQLLLTLGDWGGATTMLEALEGQAKSPGLSTRRAILSLQRGDLATAQAWVNGVNVAVGDPDEQVQEWPLAYLTLAKLQMAQRSFSGVASLLEMLAEVGEQAKSDRFLLSVRLQQALLLGKQGDIETAVSYLNQALLLAETGHLKRIFLDICDPTLTRLLHRAAGQTVVGDYARVLLREMGEGNGNGSSEATTAVSASPLFQQPLSPRELELVHYLAQGLTNRQIAEQMVVSLNTVKAHTRRLYHKLDVHNRTQAVARARERALL